jgi:surfeit locus 1 family protein
MKKLFPHIFCLLCFLGLVALGTWQLQRMEWKKELIATIDSRINGTPIQLSDYKNLDTNEYALMEVEGKFLYDKEISIMNKTFNGKGGIHSMTPLQTTAGDIILVNRGWTPLEKDPLKPEGTQKIIGVIRATQHLNYIGRHIMIDNNPAKKEWFTINLPQMYAAVNAPEKEYYLDMVNEDGNKTFPYALPKKIEIYNEHLQYVLTWYGIALALVVIYYFRFWRRKPALQQ